MSCQTDRRHTAVRTPQALSSAGKPMSASADRARRAATTGHGNASGPGSSATFRGAAKPVATSRRPTSTTFSPFEIGPTCGLSRATCEGFATRITRPAQHVSRASGDRHPDAHTEGCGVRHLSRVCPHQREPREARCRPPGPGLTVPGDDTPPHPAGGRGFRTWWPACAETVGGQDFCRREIRLGGGPRTGNGQRAFNPSSERLHEPPALRQAVP